MTGLVVWVMNFLSPCQNVSGNDVEMKQTKLAVLFGVAWKTPKLTSKPAIYWYVLYIPNRTVGYALKKPTAVRYYFILNILCQTIFANLL